MEFTHELVLPNEDLPFKIFLFEGEKGNYFRKKHWHRSIEIFAVFQGKINFYLNNNLYPLNTEEFLLVNSNEIHSISAAEPNKTIVLQIPFNTFEEYFTGEQFIQFVHKNIEYDTEIMRLLKKIFATYQKKEYGYALQVKGDYFYLLYLLVTKYREKNVTSHMLKTNQRLNRLSVITNYMKENFREKLSLSELAKTFGYAPSYLSRMFQKYTGINYKTYLQNIRLEYAFQELLNSNHTISETALNNGFPNSKAFSREFQKKYGLLPSAYRKNNIENNEKENIKMI